MAKETGFKKAMAGLKKAGEVASKTINTVSTGAIKGMDVTTKGFNQGTRKAGDSLDEVMNPTIRCSFCKSTDVTFVKNDRKSFSTKKAIAGTALFGKLGGAVGFAGKEGNKDIWLCNECKKQFKQ